MDIILEKFGEAGLNVKYKGKINLETASEYERTIKQALEEDDIKELVLDFSEIDYISSIGIRVLLELNKLMAPPKSLTLTNLGDQVSEALWLTGISGYLNII